MHDCAESCSEHDPEHPSDLKWAEQLEPDQDGKFWCFNGSHYVVVTRELLVGALEALIQTNTQVHA